MSFHVWRPTLFEESETTDSKKTQNSINKNLISPPNFETENRLIWKGLVPYVIFSVVAKENNSMLQKMPLLYPWQHFDLNSVTSGALKKQCELPRESFLSSLYRKSFPRKGDHHTHRYEYLTIPNFRLYNQRSIINWSMKKTSQSVYPLPDISSKPQPALDRVESKNGKCSNVNSIFHPGNSTTKIWKPLKIGSFGSTKSRKESRGKFSPVKKFECKRDHSFLKTWIFAWDFCWEEFPLETNSGIHFGVDGFLLGSAHLPAVPHVFG